MGPVTVSLLISWFVKSFQFLGDSKMNIGQLMEMMEKYENNGRRLKKKI